MRLFITTGTQKFQMNRLIEAVNIYAKYHSEHEYFAQTGNSSCKTEFPSKPYLNKEEFDKILENADIVVTHAGTGTIVKALEKGKTVIAVPRLKEFKEHVDDHQTEIVDAFENLGYVIPCKDTNYFEQAVANALRSRENGEITAFKTNTDKFLSHFDFGGKTVCFAASSGGHLEQILKFKAITDRENAFLVTEKAGHSSPDKDLKTLWLSQTNRKELLLIPKLCKNAFTSYRILKKENPDVIVTTGVLSVIPLCLIAKFWGKELIYIESFANFRSGTMTGKLLYRYADKFYIQNNALSGVYPNAECIGSIY